MGKLDGVDEESLFARIANAEEIGRICIEFGVHRATFYRWIEDGPEERQRAFKAARAASADTYAEMSLATLDEPVENSHEATMKKAKADRLAWMAEKLGRDTYGEQKHEPAVVLNLGSLHLDALRKYGSVPALKPGDDE